MLHPGDLLYSDHSDFLALELPSVQFQVQSCRATGELPRWCPLSFSGRVFAFVPAPQMLPFVLWDAVPESAFGPILCWMVVLHVIVAGWGMYAYARRQGLGEAGAFVAALGFMFSGAWLLHMLAGGHFFVGLAWLPFVLIYLERAVRERSLKAATIAAIFYGLLSWSLHPQIAFYAGLFVALWAGGTALEDAGYLGGIGPTSHRRTLRSIVVCGVFGLWTAGLGLALTGAQLVPTLASAEGSTRASGLSAKDLVELSRLTLFNLVGPSVHETPRWEETGGLGLVVLGLAAVAALLSPAKRVRYQAAVCGLLVLFGLGGALVLQGLPGFNLFRQPARMFVVVGFPVAYLAGVAVDALHAEQGPADEQRGLSRFILIGMTFVVGLLVWTWCTLSRQDGRELVARPYWFALGLTLPATLWLLGSHLPKPWRSGAWVAVVLIDLVALVWPEVRTRPEAEVFPVSPAVAYLAEHRADMGRVLDVDQRPELGSSIAEEDDKTPTYRTDCSPLGRGTPLSLSLGIDCVRGYSPIDIARYKMFLQFIGDNDRPMVALRDHLSFPIICNVAVRNEGLLNLLGVRYLLMPSDMAVPAGWRKVLDDPAPRAFDVTTGGMRDLRSCTLYENAKALPRAFVVTHAKRLDEDAPLAQLKQTDFREMVLLEGEFPPASGAAPRGASISRYSANEVHVHCEAGDPGYLVLTDPWHPSWTCTINGTPAEVRRADYAFRAVALPAEACDVVFRFSPASYPRGEWLTAAALGVVVLVLLLDRLRRLRATS